MDYEIRESSSPVRIAGDTNGLPTEDITYLTLWVEDEPVGQIGLLLRNGAWWADFAFIRADMRDKKLYPSLLRAMFTAASRVTDFVWSEALGVGPEEHLRREEYLGVTRQYFQVVYKGIPIDIKRWPEYRRKHNLTDTKNMKTLTRTDVRALQEKHEPPLPD